MEEIDLSLFAAYNLFFIFVFYLSLVSPSVFRGSIFRFPLFVLVATPPVSLHCANDC